MNEEQFRRRLRGAGYGEGRFKEFAPNSGGPMHSHDFSVMLLAVSGEFTLARENGATTTRPDGCRELPANSEHAERAGAGGARVLLGKK